MAANTASSAFRFTDLPPELRNRVYTFVFEDDAEDVIDAVAATAHAPNPGVTLVCRQLREEVLQLYQEAKADFWAGHTFRLFKIWPTRNCRSELDRMLRESGSLPTGVVIRKLRFMSGNIAKYNGGGQWVLDVGFDNGREITVSGQMHGATAGVQGAASMQRVCNFIRRQIQFDHGGQTIAGSGLKVRKCVPTVFNFLQIYAA